MIKYRPHTGSLEKSIKETREFDTLDEMYDYIISQLNIDDEWISKEDLCISDSFDDTRTDWHENRYVCLKRIGNEIFETPRCIGICSIE